MYTRNDTKTVERPKLCDAEHKDNNCHSNKAADKHDFTRNGTKGRAPTS